jgi:hypothetical protein
MPVYVSEMTSEVTAADGELPLTASQIEALVRIVLQRLDQANRDREHTQEATTVRSHANPRGDHR